MGGSGVLGGASGGGMTRVMRGSRIIIVALHWACLCLILVSNYKCQVMMCWS